jgi:hypothetical protein
MLLLDREKYWMTGKDASLPFPVKRVGLAANGRVETAFVRCAHSEITAIHPCCYDQKLPRSCC